MQARVIQGNEMGFNAMVYSQPDQRLLDYLQNSISVASEKLQDTGTSFINTAMNMYDKYNSVGVINAAKALVSTMDTHLNPDVILSLNEETIFNAMPKMQEYVMVQPELWELNRQQMCSAYDGVYNDVDPNVRTYEDHVRYQEVMDGMVEYDEDGNSSVTFYTSTDMEELHTYDQFSILSTWDAVNNLIIDGIDPTSENGDEL